jgi:hypothetical protein
MFAHRAKNVLYYNNVVMDDLGAECIAAAKSKQLARR